MQGLISGQLNGNTNTSRWRPVKYSCTLLFISHCDEPVAIILIFNFKSAHAKVTGLIKRIIIAATPAFD